MTLSKTYVSYNLLSTMLSFSLDVSCFCYSATFLLRVFHAAFKIFPFCPLFLLIFQHFPGIHRVFFGILSSLEFLLTYVYLFYCSLFTSFCSYVNFHLLSRRKRSLPMFALLFTCISRVRILSSLSFRI